MRNPTARTVAGVAATVFGMGYGGIAFQAYMTYLQGGSNSDILKAAAISAAQAYAFYQVGSTLPYNTMPVANVLGHGVVGGVFAEAQGGSFGSGFLSGSLGAWGSHQNVGVSIMAGGLGSVAAGGKFADGAFTAALGHMFNHELHKFISHPTLEEANQFWRSNDDPDSSLIVDASKITVIQTSEFNAKGRAQGMAAGTDYLLYGNVTLEKSARGIRILPDVYDFLPHDSTRYSWQPLGWARNYATFEGFLYASRYGTSVGTDYRIVFRGYPTVRRAK